jgi:hypothetical protein
MLAASVVMVGNPHYGRAQQEFVLQQSTSNMQVPPYFREIVHMLLLERVDVFLGVGRT